MEQLLNIDRQLFRFLNQGLSNWLLDAVMPFLTDLNRKPVVLVFLAIVFLLLGWKGGTRARLATLLLVITIIFTDQMNSSWLKFLLARPRPCHELANIHLLVGCGSGYSFPSSHAVNSFAGALVLSYFWPRWIWAYFSYAATIAFSRVYVGVHYPSDVVGGAVLGLVLAGLVLLLFEAIESRWSKYREQPRRQP